MEQPVIVDSRTTSESIELVKQFFEVNRACLVGASDGKKNPWSFNARMTRALMTAQLDRLDLVGRVSGVINGHPVVSKVSETDGTGGGLCVLVIRADQVVPTVREALRVGWDRFLIISELGDSERAELAELIPDSARVWGPNCVGYKVSHEGLNFMATDAEYILNPNRGRIALLSQSGGALGSMATLVEEAGLGVSHLLSVGEESDVGIEDVLEYFAATDSTDGVVLFVEEARRPEAFLRALRNCRNRGLPVVIVKVGRSAAAQQAAQDHTGALAGDWEEFAAAVRAHGGIIGQSFRDAVYTTALLVNNGGQRFDGRTAIFTSSGGSGALAADLIEESNLSLSPLDAAAQTVAMLNTRNATLNPFDSATGGGTPNTLKPYLEALEADPSVGSLMFLTSGGIYGEFIAETLASNLLTKPIVFVSSDIEDEQRDQLLDGKVLIAPDVADAVTWLSQAALPTGRVGVKSDDDAEDTSDETWSTYGEGTRLLAEIGVSRPGTRWISGNDVAVADPQLSFPVVAKAGNLRGHKARYGGVRTGIHTQEHLRTVLEQMGSKFEELVIEEHAPSGPEILVTATSGTLGGMLVIGFGGKHVDALGDQVIISRSASADDIVHEIRRTPLYTFLESTLASADHGARAIADLASQLSSAIDDYNLESIEINPVILTDVEAIACDVKVQKRSEGQLVLGGGVHARLATLEKSTQ